jgi:hypothetical protein
MPTTMLVVRCNEVDSWGLPRRGKKLGDRLAFTDELTHINNAPIPGGQHSGTCVLVREPTMWLCEAGFILPGIPGTIFPNGGQIEARGLMDFPGDPPWPFRAAITGGIGPDYRRAQGDIEGTNTPPRTDWTLGVETP